jgi:hypothetical protein
VVFQTQESGRSGVPYRVPTRRKFKGTYLLLLGPAAVARPADSRRHAYVLSTTESGVIGWCSTAPESCRGPSACLNCGTTHLLCTVWPLLPQKACVEDGVGVTRDLLLWIARINKLGTVDLMVSKPAKQYG